MKFLPLIQEDSSAGNKGDFGFFNRSRAITVKVTLLPKTSAKMELIPLKLHLCLVEHHGDLLGDSVFAIPAGVSLTLTGAKGDD